MAASALVYFALVCVSVVYTQTSCDNCVTKTLGITDGMPKDLKEFDLPPPNNFWDIGIPPVCGPYGNQGVKVKVCDPDIGPAPIVDIESTAKVIIQRNANKPLRNPAKLYITAYCQVYDG